MLRSPRPRRARAQGMVEYIAIVALIGIALIAVVSVNSQGSYGNAVDEAIQGTTDRTSGISGAMGGNAAAADILSGGGAMTEVGRTDRGIKIYRDSGGNMVTSSGESYVPATHGSL